MDKILYNKSTVETTNREIVRKMVIERDNRQCVECGSTEELNVHHVIPEKYGGKYIPDNLITLCRTCHSSKHIEYQTGLFASTVYKVANLFRSMLKLPLLRDYNYILFLLTSQKTFRTKQKEIIDEVMKGKDVVAVMPTGSGKSICFQIPGILLENQTIVITPLKALMKDQVESLWQKRIPATFINSDLDKSEKERRLNFISQKLFRFIYVAPEQFFDKDSDYQLKLKHSLLENKYDLLVIDEAHCVDKWGRSFRPSYALLNNLRTAIGNPRTIALTASASKRAQVTIRESLGLKKPSVYVTGFFRPEITLETKFFNGGKEAVIEEKIKYITQIIGQNPDQKIIIFVPTIKIGNLLWKGLVKNDVNTEFFSSKSHIEDKIRMQDEYKGVIKSNLKVLICTSAFGMGVNIKDIRIAIHWNLTENIEDYYQQMGRIGRDGLKSRAILLYAPDDERLIRYITNKALENNPKKLSIQEKNTIRKIEEQELQTMLQYIRTNNKWRFILDYFGEHLVVSWIKRLLNSRIFRFFLNKTS